jgi:hypothetical protein
MLEVQLRVGMREQPPKQSDPIVQAAPGFFPAAQSPGQLALFRQDVPGLAPPEHVPVQSASPRQARVPVVQAPEQSISLAQTVPETAPPMHRSAADATRSEARTHRVGRRATAATLAMLDHFHMMKPPLRSLSSDGSGGTRYMCGEVAAEDPD